MCLPGQFSGKILVSGTMELDRFEYTSLVSMEISMKSL